jgi:hypothetical protein
MEAAEPGSRFEIRELLPEWNSIPKADKIRLGRKVSESWEKGALPAVDRLPRNAQNHREYVRRNR